MPARSEGALRPARPSSKMLDEAIARRSRVAVDRSCMGTIPWPGGIGRGGPRVRDDDPQRRQSRGYPGRQLSLDTPYPAVEAAAGGKVSLTLNVRTDAARRVDLAVTSVPKGWGASLHGGGFLIGSVTADPKAPPDIKLEVKIPDDAATGTYRIVVRATSSGVSSSLPVDSRI